MTCRPQRRHAIQKILDHCTPASGMYMCIVPCELAGCWGSPSPEIKGNLNEIRLEIVASECIQRTLQ